MPRESVEASRLTAFAGFLIETATPGKTAPDSSVTVPSMLPPAAWDWPSAANGRSRASNNRVNTTGRNAGVLERSSDMNRSSLKMARREPRSIQ